jgi:ssDNA-binding Zn-finger/Zn-ribbon topoisomerase 1
MTQICPKCGKELRIWEIVDYPPAWIKAHPEIAGMCWTYFLEWQEEQQKKAEEKNEGRIDQEINSKRLRNAIPSYGVWGKFPT